MTTRSKLTFLKLGHAPKVREANKIVVMGAEDVGKTALTVRFLTRKYLPEYTHGNVTCYERQVQLDDKEISVRIIDTPGSVNITSETQPPLQKQETYNQADGFLVVYSSTDKRSFAMAREILKRLHQEFETIGTSPVALIANKDDLSHFRRVSTLEGQRLALVYPRCTFYECSAASDPDNVDIAFREFLREVIQNKESKKHLSVGSSLTVKSPSNPRRNSAGNSTLSNWWRRPRSSSACENRQDRTFTM